MHTDWKLTEDTQNQFLLLTLQQISTSLAQLVLIEQQRLSLEKQNMPPNVIQALIDLLNKFVALVQAEAGNAQALADAQASLAALQASDASAAALVPSAQAAIDAANAAVPPTPAP
jgi:hypothetical protein